MRIGLAKGYIASASTLGGVAAALCLLAVAATNPLAIGPLGVTIWFLGLLVAVSSLTGVAAYIVARRLKPNAVDGQRVNTARRRGFFIGSYLTVLLALSSLKQLNLRDAILLAILLVLVEFYLVAKQ